MKPRQSTGAVRVNDSDRLAAIKAQRAALADDHTCLGLDWLSSIDWLVGEVERLQKRDSTTLKIMLDFDDYIREQRITSGPLLDLRNRYLNEVVAAERPFWETSKR